ncbi:hypothetical protein BKA58DRAFT_442457 [Alternaria rosae]|uniref:uncharacterized protein n=1 Tax=Alternaria rosae TaxID=1187941 RepID=UPI001E8D52F6|nr:uncharacterized protein BKA58DRAFT_442457 [Alternaria rosae]KAH6865684.1 hypothetical protein BKA58DRAFT_442457 [Alternaria rosae]
MSQAYEREQQNNSRLDELASKVSALRGVTIDIYDNARDQHVIDSTSNKKHALHGIPAQHVPTIPPHLSQSWYQQDDSVTT